VAEHVRPRLVVSRCLTGAACRWDGEVLAEAPALGLRPLVVLRPVCPEVAVGLGVPRDPIHLVRADGAVRLVQPATGRDLTDRMQGFAEAFLDGLGGGVDGFLLKSRSPSCALRDAKVRAAVGSASGSCPGAGPVVGRGPGLFGEAVRRRFAGLAVEDERRLADPARRDHFLAKLFLRAAFRTAARRGSGRALVRFHARSRGLLEVYSRSRLRRLDRLAAQASAEGATPVLLAAYAEHLDRALARPLRREAMARRLLADFQALVPRLRARERRRFLDLLEAYRAGQGSVAVVGGWLAARAERLGRADLAQAAHLRPFPEALAGG